MKKVQLIMVGLLMSLCVTACSSGEKTASVCEGAALENTVESREESNQEPEEAMEPATAGEEAESYSNIPVLTGGGLPFSNMTVVNTHNYSDGSYYYEDKTEDGYTTVINCAYPSMREDGEKPEDYAARVAVVQSLYDARQLEVRKNEHYSEKLGVPVYIVTFTAGENVDVRHWTVLVTENLGYTYFYGFDIWADASEGMDEIIDDIFDGLFWMERESEAEIGNISELSIEDLREIASANGYLCAAAFLGYSYDMDIASFLEEVDLTDYPFLSEIPAENYVEQPDGGYEIYCIIPADPGSSLAVNEWIMDESNGFYGEPGQVLYRSESGEPILLRGNPSDIVPGTQVVVVDNAGEVLEWNPSLSLYDGSMMYCPGVLDFTNYSSESFFGWWSALLPDGSERVLNLNFQRPGNHMSYSYGYGNSELIAAYVGTWSVDAETAEQSDEKRITFFMENMEDPSDKFRGVYTLRLIDETHMDVIHEDGQPLCEGLEYMACQFEWDSY